VTAPKFCSVYPFTSWRCINLYLSLFNSTGYVTWTGGVTEANPFRFIIYGRGLFENPPISGTRIKGNIQYHHLRVWEKAGWLGKTSKAAVVTYFQVLSKHLHG